MATGSEAIHRLFKRLLAILILAGCAELPVPIRAPYSAAPASYSAPWQPPPPAITTNGPQGLAGRGTPVPVDASAVYGLADLIDFAHRANPETRRRGKKRGPPPRR